MYTPAFAHVQKPSLMKRQYDFGFTDLGSCEAVCNSLWNGVDGCVALEWQRGYKHCVVYNGTALTQAQWTKARQPGYSIGTESFSVCMLTAA